MTKGRPAKDRGIQPTRGDGLPMLANRTDLPPRVRNMLGGLLELTGNWFEPAIRRALDDLEHALFSLAERSGNSQKQQGHLEHLRAIKHARADIAPRFLQHVESTLAGLRTTPARATAEPAREGPRTLLELVDSTVLEEDLALQEIASKAEIRNSQDLHALAQRLAVIAATPAWNSDQMPLGPARLADAFRYCLLNIDLDIEHRILIYKQFDQAAMLTVSSFYQGANNWLIEQRVLPNLRLPSYRRDAATPAAQAAQGPDGNDAAAPRDSLDGHIAHDHVDAELFGTLRHLLGERRRVEGHGAPESSPGPVSYASPADLQSLLGNLQRTPSGGSRQQRYDSEHFKNTLLVKLRRSSPADRPLNLSGEDTDTVDLIGMLFDYVTRNVREGSSARSLLSRLHVPVLRVALGDKTFFTRRDHPARELLNTIAETGARWMDDGDSDTDLVDKMQLVVDQVGSEFDGDLGVFEKLLGDLGQHMQLIARRAEVVERRHIDAAKGHDRLQIARDAARSAVMRLIQDHAPPPRVQALLEQAWTDALALSALREGPGGSEFQRRLAAAGNLARRGAQALSVTPDDNALRGELDAGLRQVGLHEDDVRGVLDNLHIGTASAAPAKQEQLKHIDTVLKGKTRLGGKAAGANAAVKPVPLNAAEAEMLQRIKKLPFGTWFDFVVNQQGETVRRKLAWYSPLTGHCLFVNHRGARCEDLNLDQLARDMVRGQVRVAVPEQGSLIDRAWKAIIDILRPAADAADPAGASA